MQKLLLLSLFTVIISSCQQAKFNPEWTKETAPEIFHATFETTKGDFEITVNRKWSPNAADRFYQLIKHGYFDNTIFYRVVPEFVAQFGHLDTITRKPWQAHKVADEPLIMGNRKGTLSFARFGKDTRDLEVFINLQDNAVLDTLEFESVKGFPAFGIVSKGMENVQKLYSGYAETPMADENLYMNPAGFYSKYPKLDLIKKASINDEN